jgi:hypothetical protein
MSDQKFSISNASAFKTTRYYFKLLRASEDTLVLVKFASLAPTNLGYHRQVYAMANLYYHKYCFSYFVVTDSIKKI